jgi:hypothetical protein
MRAAVVAEKAGIPALTIVVPMFANLARHTARGMGVANPRLAQYPGSIENHSPDEVKENVEKIFDSILESLGKPLQSESKSQSVTVGSPERNVFKGNFDEVNDFFYEKKWTDGLPIVPPTVEAVEKLLQWTDIPRHQEIATLPLSNLKATPWNIAVNAVMAGCRPEYMPILVAAVEAFGEPAYQLKDVGSTISIKPFIVVNGPIVKQLNINYGCSLMAPGNRANSTIGRALGLIVRNIAGFREGETSMGTYGWPGTPWVMAEDEDHSPWNPYHVDRGFDRNASTVTAMMMTNMSHQFGIASHEAKTHLRKICYNVTKAFSAYVLRFGERSAWHILMTPPNAKVMADGGYSKQSIKEYIAQNAKLSVGEIDADFDAMYSITPTVHELAEQAKLPLSWDQGSGARTLPKSWDLGPNNKIPVVLDPKLINIIVCGSIQRNRDLVMCTAYSTPVTKEIRMPAHQKL